MRKRIPKTRRAPKVALARRYGVLTTRDAERIARTQLRTWAVGKAVRFGLPEIDDRYHVWRVPLLHPHLDERVGEIVIDAKHASVQTSKSTSPQVLRTRLHLNGSASSRNGVARKFITPEPERTNRSIVLRDCILTGDSAAVLAGLPSESVDLVFTSPPYYNARPDYTDYTHYDAYLEHLRTVIAQCGRMLGEGRFFIINVAPVLLRREQRSSASRRIAVPFDVHRILIEEGFDFIDDIIWQKPEGAGWATGRGRRFAADRNPLQYKAVPVTEYVLVYRKHTDKLIDTHIRRLAGTKRLAQSKIAGDYDRTNVWTISPTSSRKHPAVFPLELARRVIRYYSFVGDTVLDPFAGIGTVGKAAVELGRHFVLVDSNPKYVAEMRRTLPTSRD